MQRELQDSRKYIACIYTFTIERQNNNNNNNNNNVNNNIDICVITETFLNNYENVIRNDITPISYKFLDVVRNEMKDQVAGQG